ncbi:MAG: Shedu immune nuclease family protein, partial [Hylemonella sp.]
HFQLKPGSETGLLHRRRSCGVLPHRPHATRLGVVVQTFLRTRTFIAQRDISVFRKIDELIDEPIIVGGIDSGAIPLDDFGQLLDTFPTSTELTHYARSRIARVLKDYFGTLSEAEERLNRYLRSKDTLATDSRESLFANFELQKFEYIHAELQSMLSAVDSFTEKDWQTKILGLLLFVFPKYIAVLENVHIKDFYSVPGKASDRYIDLMLVDSNGSIDIIEVKKPFSNALLSRQKYRNNYTPRNELAGTVMQAEKYLFHLSKWGCAGEQEIYKKRKSELPYGVKLKITNPKALILIGRDVDFDDEQRFDFEIIRRKYANMIDIMTYDDLLRRLGNIIAAMKNRSRQTRCQVLRPSTGSHSPGVTCSITAKP